MLVKRILPSGYCKGVINAIELVKKTREKYPNENIFILGMIVHNSFVSEQLKDLGIITLDDDTKSKEELLDTIDSGVVVFTAHGISEQIKNKAIEKGLIVVDASCEDVLKTQRIVKEYLNNGYDVLYFGKRNHPEAMAVLAISDDIHFIAGKEDIEKLKINNSKIVITNQTTMSYLELRELFDIVKNKYPNVLIIEEICKATSSRQQAIAKVNDGDILYVVGDIKSNNTNKLKEIGLLNFKKVYLINNASEIKKTDLNDQSKVYVSAGASTPPILIDEVMKKLNELAAEFTK